MNTSAKNVVWLVAGVCVGLLLAGGVVIAAAEERYAGVELYTLGLGMDDVMPTAPETIEWPESKFIEGNTWTTYNYLQAFSKETGSYADATVSMNVEVFDIDNDTLTDAATVRADSGGPYLACWSNWNGGHTTISEVKAQFDGDVVITLGD